MKTWLGVLFFLLFFSFTAAGAAPLDNQQEQLEEIKQKLAKEKENLQKTKEKEQETLSKLVTVNKELKSTDEELEQAETRINLNERRIKVFTREIIQTTNNLQEKGQTLEQRIREIYKGSSANYLELFISSASAADFLNRSYYFGRVLKRDADLINALQQDYQKLENRRSALKKTNEEVRTLAVVIKDKREEIAKAAEEKRKIYEDLKDRRVEYERRVEELERSSEELENLINKTVAQRKKTGKVVYAATGQFSWPLRGRLTSYFGARRSPFWGGRQFHTGIDIAAPYGESITAADAGEVIFSGWWDGYGKAVVIDHGRGLSTVYAHMSRIYANNNKSVAKGEVIGLVGNTGYSTGPHLHFEIRQKGKPQNPLKWLP